MQDCHAYNMKAVVLNNLLKMSASSLDKMKMVCPAFLLRCLDHQWTLGRADWWLGSSDKILKWCLIYPLYMHFRCNWKYLHFMGDYFSWPQIFKFIKCKNVAWLLMQHANPQIIKHLLFWWFGIQVLWQTLKKKK